METADDITKWQEQTNLSVIRIGPVADIERAMNIGGSELSSSSPVQLDEVMGILTNYYIYISHQMGVIFARIKYIETVGGDREVLAAERAKLSIIKPVHEAIRLKIDVIKQIYYRKTKEVSNATSHRS